MKEVSNPVVEVVKNSEIIITAVQIYFLSTKENNNGIVTVEHLFIGLLEEGEGVAIRILLSMNIDIECSCSECGYKFNVRRKYKCKYIGIEYLEE